MRWQLGAAALTAYDADGFIGVQVDPLSGSGEASSPFELFHQFGFSSRPTDPTDDGACSLLHAVQGRHGFAWALSDPRVTGKLPQLRAGGSQQYAATGAFSQLDGETGSYTLYVPYAFVNGIATKAMCVSVSVDTEGEERIQIITGAGLAITMNDAESEVNVRINENSWLDLKPDTATLNFKNVVINGSLLVGGAGGVPVLTGSPGSPVPSTRLFVSPT